MKLRNWLQQEFYVILALMLFTIMIANDSFLPAMQVIADDLDSKIATVNLSFALLIFGAFLVQVPVGIISDKIGRRPMILIGGVIFFIATLVITRATSIELFMTCRFFQGLASGFFSGTANTMISESYEYKKRVSAMAMLNQLSLLAPMMGPLVGTYILLFNNDDWHYIYIYNYMLFIVLLVIAVFSVPETLQKMNPADNNNQQNDESAEKPEQEVEQKKENLFDLFKVKSFSYITFALAFRIFMALVWVSGSPKIIMLDLMQSKQVYSYSQIVVFSALILGNMFAGRASRSILPSKYIRNHLYISTPILTALFVITLFNYNLYTIMTLMTCLLFAAGSVLPVKQSIVVTEIKSKGFAMSVMVSVITLWNIAGSAIPAFMYGLDPLWMVGIFVIATAIVTFLTVLALPHIRKMENHL